MRYSALLGFHRKVECSHWEGGRTRESRLGEKSQIRVTNGIFWTIGLLAKQISPCASTVSNSTSAYFDGNFFENLEDWKGCVAQSLVLRELTRAETFLQLNLKLKEILSCNEASCPWTQPVRPDLEFDQKSKKLDLEFDTWKWTEPVIKPEGCQKARYWAW